MNDQSDLSKLRIDKAQFSQSRRGHKGRWFGLLALAVALLSAGYLYAQGVLGPAVEVRVAGVSALYPAQTFTVLNASGYVVAQRKAAVGSKLTSRLVYLGVEEGDQVKEGQVVARLENADLLAARDRARAAIDVTRTTLAQAEAELKDATAAYERAKELLTRRFSSQAEYDASEARYRKAVAALANAKAGLKLSETQLAETEVQLAYAFIGYRPDRCKNML